MNCPNCHGLLQPGEAFFKKPLTDLAVHGLGSKDLHMQTEKGADFLLLAATDKAAAQFCPECAVVVIATEKGRRSALRSSRSE